MYATDAADLPKYLKAIFSTWEEPGFEHCYVSNKQAYQLVQDIYGVKWTQILDKCDIPMVQSDVARVLLIYEFGGLYVDIDTILKTPLNEWVDFSKEAVLMKSNWGPDNIINTLFAFSPKHPLLKAIIDEMFIRCTAALDKNQRLIPLHTGPAVFTSIFEANPFDPSAYQLIPMSEKDFIHINGLSLKDNLDFYRNEGSNDFDFMSLTDLYSGLNLLDVDIKIYKRRSGYGS